MGNPWEAGEFIEVINSQFSEDLRAVVHRPSRQGRSVSSSCGLRSSTLADLTPVEKTQFAKLSLIEEMYGHSLDGFSRPIFFSPDPGLDHWSVAYLNKAFATVDEHIALSQCREFVDTTASEFSRDMDVIDLTAVTDGDPMQVDNPNDSAN